MSTRKRMAALAVVGIISFGGAVCSPRRERPKAALEANRPPAIRPDYAGVTIPPNLAPLNFRVLEPADRFYVRVQGPAGPQIEVFSARGEVRFSESRWRSVVRANRGQQLSIEIYGKRAGRWTHFQSVLVRVAMEEIDPYAVYRLIPPVYNKWDHITLRQRDLRSFQERVILDNIWSRDSEGRNIENACLNCHTFLNYGTRQMALHIRPAKKHQIPAMILTRDGKAQMVDTRAGGPPAAYISWHPGGRLLTFSRNRLVQMFHTAGEETREVVDLNSDLGLYDLDSGRTYTVEQISRPDRLETFPAWAPDGRYLYFCSAPKWADRPNAVLDYNKVRYDLVRVAYDPGTGRWGEVETLVRAAELGRSVSLPRVSPGGRYVVFCGHDYGSFPVYQPSSDLYLLDVSKWEQSRTRAGAGGGSSAVRKLDEINSPRSDSYSSWSSNGRWLLFSSKRDDGLFARLYGAYFSPEGRFHKPWMLPQEDPDAGELLLMTYNRAELIREPVSVPEQELVRAIREARSRPGDARAGQTDTPWQPVR